MSTHAEARRSHGSGTIESRGPGRWLVRVSYGRDSLTGRRIREAVTVTGSRRDAEKVLRRLLVGQETGHGPRQARARLTVGAWMDEFVRTDPAASEATRRRMQQSWRLYASDRLRATPLRELSPARLSDELARLREQVSPRTKQKMGGRTVGIFHAILRAGLSHAVEQGIISTNPAKALRRPKDETICPPAPHLTVEEAGRFLTAVADDPLAAYWLVQVEAGLRPSEGLALHWHDVDPVGGTLTVRHALVRNNAGWELAVPKSHQVRSVTISAATVRALREHERRQKELRLLHGPRYQDERLVFADEIGRPLNPYAVSKRFKTLALAAGLRPDVRLYSLRHSSATHALQDGMDIKSVAAKLGHSTPVVTLTTYAHAAGLDRQRESTERLAARYRAVTPSPARG